MQLLRNVLLLILGSTICFFLMLGFVEIYEQFPTEKTELVKIERVYENVQINKPSYDYLKSVTVYLYAPNTETDNGSVGTGVIVAEKNDYYYVMTNKHVCGETNTLCFAVTDFNRKEKSLLEFVKQEILDYDIALWRIKKSKLLNKRVVKGFSDINHQDKVYSVGNYLSIPYIYTEGTFAGYSGNYNLFNLPCAPGCSGSGVFDENGNLVSILFASYKINLFYADTSKLIGVDNNIIKLFLREFI